MARTTAAISEDQRYEKEGNLLKTYIVEAHTGDELSALEILDREVNQVFGRRQTATLSRSEDEPDLAWIDFSTSSHQARFYADVLDSRYWLLHTLSPSDVADRYLNRLVQRSTALDHLWLTSDLIEKLGGTKNTTGFGVEFQGSKSLGYPTSPDLRLHFLTSASQHLVDLLRSDNIFASSVALSKVRVRHSVEGDGNKFCNDEFRYNGKITVRGNSFTSHIDLTQQLIATYGSKVRELEAYSAIGYSSSENGLRIDGAPLTIELTSVIANLEQFCETVFDGSPPFRLLGVPVELGKGAYRVKCLDLHVGESITFEVFPDSIRLYFQKGTCGNSVLRFLTNLQHTVDAQARATVTATGEIL